jgi:hypothetical protein
MRGRGGQPSVPTTEEWTRADTGGQAAQEKKRCGGRVDSVCLEAVARVAELAYAQDVGF